MRYTLTLELSDRAFSAIQQQAESEGVAPESLAAVFLEQRFNQMLKHLQPDGESQAASSKFEQHFGTLSLEQTIDIDINTDNESIDADLAREYVSTHEGDD
jgi:hypothetical protein